MAGRLKGTGGIKGLFLLHGEKIAIALVGLTALWLIYKATSLPHLEPTYQADKLRSKITETSSAVTNSTWPDPGSEQAAEVRVAKPLAEKLDAQVSPDVYVNKTADGKVANPFSAPIIAPTVLRTDPTFLNVVDVRGFGGAGQFAFVDAETQRQRELQRQREEAERAKKEADRAAKEAKANEANPEGGPGRRGNRGGEGPEGMNQPYDPEHPKRRQLMGTAAALGVQRQGFERIEQAHWACVVAKVPIREQLKLYQDAFTNAKLGFDPARDFPRYKGYLVQRAEVVAGKPIEDADWKPVSVLDGQKKGRTVISPNGVGEPVMIKLYEQAAKVWAGMMPDVVDSRFTDFVLTFPLPPLVGRDWGAEATHPDIPLLINTPPLQEEVAPVPTTPAPNAPGGENFDPFAGAPPGSTVPTVGMPQFPGPGGGPGFRPGMGMGGRFGGEGEFRGGPGFRPGMGMGMGGRGFGPEGEGGPRGGGGFVGGGMTPGQQRVSLPKGVDFLLLRFFDFTVEPGKKYKYRVQLVLADPNYGMPENTLAPTVLDRHRKDAQAARANKGVRQDIVRLNEWSEPSPTVGIPLAGSVKLMDVKPSPVESINSEPVANLLVESFDIDEKGNAIQAGNKKELRRGAVANMVEDARYVGEGWTDEWKNFKFITGMTVVDVDGGKKLANEYKSLGRVMVMGPSGELHIRNELDDKPAVDYHKLLFEQTENSMNPGFEGEPGYGPGGPRGRGNFRGGGGERGGR